jgi:hypothetical protein
MALLGLDRLRKFQLIVHTTWHVWDCCCLLNLVKICYSLVWRGFQYWLLFLRLTGKIIVLIAFLNLLKVGNSNKAWKQFWLKIKCMYEKNEPNYLQPRAGTLDIFMPFLLVWLVYEESHWVSTFAPHFSKERISSRLYCNIQGSNCNLCS